MSNEFLDFVEDILDAMDKAEILLEGVTYEQFESDFRINFAVVRALEIIGEATKRLPMDLREQYPDIPGKGWLECGIASFMGMIMLTTRLFGMSLKTIFHESGLSFSKSSRNTRIRRYCPDHAST